jgi:hypothetical protein
MFKQYRTHFESSTPNVEVSEGVRPAQHFQVPDYLPLMRYDNRAQDFKVLSHGKVVAVDSDNYVVPAGLLLDIEAAQAAGDFSTVVNKYSSLDVANGIRNAAGELVTENEAVVASFFTDADATETLIKTVSLPLGIAAMDAYVANGAGYGPGYHAGMSQDYTYKNYSMQQGVTILTKYFIELPVVSNVNQVLFPGMAVFEGTPSINGIVTFNARSNFASLGALALSTFTSTTPNSATDAELLAEFNRVIGYTNKLAGRYLGKIMFIDDKWPKGYLQYVRTWEAGVVNTIDKSPGTPTDGLPDMLVYAGQTNPDTAKMVRINIVIS